jgi:hypothetical protein
MYYIIFLSHFYFVLPLHHLRPVLRLPLHHPRPVLPLHHLHQLLLLLLLLLRRRRQRRRRRRRRRYLQLPEQQLSRHRHH